MARAEQIRARIAATTANDIAVTASFGVASIPENCSRGTELLPTADLALYQAKDQGRGRDVGAAARAPSADMIQHSNSGWALSDAVRIRGESLSATI
jgi:predicted signal transduction protein with EAL and GGDEF domain